MLVGVSSHDETWWNNTVGCRVALKLLFMYLFLKYNFCLDIDFPSLCWACCWPAGLCLFLPLPVNTVSQWTLLRVKSDVAAAKCWDLLNLAKKDGWPRCPQVKTQKHTTKGGFFQYQWFVLYKWKNSPCPKLNRRNKLLWVAFCLHAMPFSFPTLLPANHSMLHPEAPEKGQEVNYFCLSKKHSSTSYNDFLAVFHWAVSVSASWYCALLPRHNDTGTQQSCHECQWQCLFLLWLAKTYAVKIYSKLHSVSHCQSISRCLCLFPPSP